MRFHEFCLFVCTTPALGMVALKLEKRFDDRFLLYYFLSLSLPLYRSLSICSPAICLCLSYFLLSLSLSFLFLSLPPSFFLLSLLSFLSPSSVSNSTLSRSLSCECTFFLDKVEFETLEGERKERREGRKKEGGRERERERK